MCVVVAAALWWKPEGSDVTSNIWGLALCLLTTYIIMETNAQQHIIRIRTRMMSCVWLVLSTSLSFMHPLGEPLLAATFLCGSYYLLFRCYQQYQPQLMAFHSFLMLGIGSFFAPIMLPMAISFFLYMIFFLRSLTKKAFWAGILGLIVPFWCYGAWCFVTGNAFKYRLPFNDLKPFSFVKDLGEAEIFSFAVIALLSIISIIHYLRTNYDDKIRVRMILYIYVSQTLLLMAFLMLQPAHYETTMALIVASASPLIAHYFSLSKSILTTLLFVLSLLLITMVAALNLWLPPSFSF